MPNESWYTIVNLSLPATSVAWLLAVLFTGVIIILQLEKKSLDAYLNVIFIFFFVWKFSFVVTNWQDVIRYPLSLIYYNGGVVGVILAIVASVSYAIWQIHKEKSAVFVRQWVFFCLISYSSYEFFYALLNDMTLAEQIALVLISVVFGIVIVVTYKQKMEGWLFLSVLVSIGYMVFSIVIEPLGWQQPKLLLPLSVCLLIGYFNKFKKWSGKNEDEVDF